MDWYPFHYKKFREKTLHLSAEQDGIYRRLIDYYMEIRKPLPDDDDALARISGVSVDCFKLASSRVKAFFTSHDGQLHHEMCNEMLDEQDKKARFHSERAKKGAAARHKKTIVKQEDAASSKQEAPLTPATITVNNKILDTNVSNKKKDDWDLEIKMKFDSFWVEYPGHGANGARGNGYKGTKAKALEKFTKIINEGEDYEEIIRGCRAYTEHLNRSGYPSKHAATWLNQSGWKDDYAETIPANKNNKQSYGHEKPGYSDTLRSSVESAKEILRMGENGQGDEKGRENRISGNDAGIGGIPLLSFDASE